MGAGRPHQRAIASSRAEPADPQQAGAPGAAQPHANDTLRNEASPIEAHRSQARRSPPHRSRPHRSDADSGDAAFENIARPRDDRPPEGGREWPPSIDGDLDESPTIPEPFDDFLTRSRRAPARWRRSGLVLSARRQAWVFMALLAVALAAGFSIRQVETAMAAVALVGGGVLIATLGAMALEAARGAIRSPLQVLRQAKLSTLAVVPLVEDRELRQVAPDSRVLYRFVQASPASRYAASIRGLRSRMPLRRGVVAVVPVAANDGASTLALSVAAAVVAAGGRAIVLDCDLRRRTVSRLTGVPATQDLLAVARDDGRDLDGLVFQDPSTGVHVLGAQRPDNTFVDVFSAGGFRGLLRDLSARYDLVLLDCPPALSSVDAKMIARFADATVLVATWDATSSGALSAAARRLRSAGVRLVGLTLNRR